MCLSTGGMPAPGGVPGPGGGVVSQHALRQTPWQMATVTGSMHPTGMHSCGLTVYQTVFM